MPEQLSAAGQTLTPVSPTPPVRRCWEWDASSPSDISAAPNQCCTQVPSSLRGLGRCRLHGVCTEMICHALPWDFLLPPPVTVLPPTPGFSVELVGGAGTGGCQLSSLQRQMTAAAFRGPDAQLTW